MSTSRKPDRSAPRSPLYTSKPAELAKRTSLETLGRDRDGAFRATRRLPEVAPE
jgi:hypothetical protein